MKDTYLKLLTLVRKNWDSLSIKDKLQLLFEFSQKRILLAWFLSDKKVLDFFTHVDPDILYKRNKQDFVYFGRILSNDIVIANLPKQLVIGIHDKYLRILSEKESSKNKQEVISQGKVYLGNKNQAGSEQIKRLHEKLRLDIEKQRNKLTELFN